MNYFDLMIRRSRNSEPPAPAVPDDEVWYYAPEQVTLYSETNVLSHTFADGKGIVKYSAPLTEMPNTLRGTGITNVEMPDGITSIGYYAFNGCNSLALTFLPEGVTIINNGAFSFCYNLALTSLPDGITSIGVFAFNYCSNLAFTSLPSELTIIGDQAFFHCSNLTSITFTGVPTSISSNAFSDCTNLLDIYVPWHEGDVANAPWGATNATVHYLDESSSSDISDSSSSDMSDSSSSGSSSGGIPTDYVFYAPLVDKNESTAVTGQTLTYSGTINNDVIDSKACLHLINGNIKMTDTTVIPTGKKPFTQSIWFYLPEWQKCGVFTHGVNSTYGSIHIQCTDTQNKLNGGGWYLDYMITSSLSIGQWHHVVQTYDGTQFASYLDGVPMTHSVNSNVNVRAGNIAIGCQPTGNEASRNIYVCQAMLYDRVLTSDEITAIYNAGIDDDSDSSESYGGSLTVTGSSTAEINGTYTDTGDTFASKPVYAKAGTPYVIYYSSGMVGTWIIYDNTDNMLEGVIVYVKHTLENGAGPQGTYTGGVTVGG